MRLLSGVLSAVPSSALTHTPFPLRSFLQLTSVLAGLGLSIREANAEAAEWSFIVSDHAGTALSYGVATALLELLSVGVGRVQPIRVPLFATKE